jgi:hypothetical protein
VPVEAQGLVLVVVTPGAHGQLALPSHWKKLPHAVSRRVIEDSRSREPRRLRSGSEDGLAADNMFVDLRASMELL